MIIILKGPYLIPMGKTRILRFITFFKLHPEPLNDFIMWFTGFNSNLLKQ